MRIGIDARLYFESGVGRYIKNTLSELDKYCLDNPPLNKYYIFLTHKGFSTLEFKSESMIKVEANFPWHSLIEQFGYTRLLNSYKLDVMHFTYFSLPIFYKRKFVVTVHDLIINKINTGKATTLPKPLYKMKRLGYLAVMNHAVKKSRFIISPSDTTKKEILSTYKINKDKIIVVPEGIDSSFLEKEVKPEQPVPKKFILYVGNAYPHKNLDRLIEAFESIKSKIDEDLVLVGKSDYFYKKLDNKTRNNNRIFIMHNISDSNLSYLYKRASLLAAPSLMEGFGLTPLEAMGHDCLPVVSSIDAFKQVCENAALYFNPEDIQDISVVLYRASKLNENEKNQYKKLFKKRLELFSWKKSLLGTLKVYESCNSI